MLTQEAGLPCNSTAYEKARTFSGKRRIMTPSWLGGRKQSIADTMLRKVTQGRILRTESPRFGSTLTTVPMLWQGCLRWAAKLVIVFLSIRTQITQWIRRIFNIWNVHVLATICWSEEHNRLSVRSSRYFQFYLHLLITLLTNKRQRVAEDLLEYSRIRFENQLFTTIISANLPFCIVQNSEFKRLLHLARSNIEIPSCKRLRSLLDERAATIKSQHLQDLSPHTNVSLTLDCWSSLNQYSFLAIMAHYVSKDWKY